jgi:hypothetical protein
MQRCSRFLLRRATLLIFTLVIFTVVLGATYPVSAVKSDLWSLQPVLLPESPSVKDQHWGCNPIDAFILSALEAKGLKPAPEADRRTLIRRVTFDLTGLPPTPDEITAFIADKSPGAYEKVVDRLLASPHYGERWGRHWLDVARFGESHGYEYDRLREHAWRYRDYVVQSLNADKPYDQFLREQIAGDVLPGAGEAGVVATGFLVAGPMDEAGKAAAGLQVRLRAREEEMEDIVGLVGQTCLGMTVNCARCHDHKFDPIPTRDYYRFKSALAGVNPGNRSILSPQLQKVNAEHVARLRKEQVVLQRQIEAIQEPILARLSQARQAGKAATLTALSVPRPVLSWTFEGDSSGTLIGGARIENGRLILPKRGASFQTPPLTREIREKTLEAWVRLANVDQQGGSALTLETEKGAQFDAIVFGERQRGKWMAGSEFFHRTKDVEAPIEIISEKATRSEWVQMMIVYHADNRIEMYRNGNPYASAYTPVGTEGTLRTYPAGESHLLFGQRHTGSPDTLVGEIEEARLYDRALSAAEVKQAFECAPFNVPAEALEKALTPTERRTRDELRTKLNDLTKEIMRFEAPQLTYATNATQPEPTHILLRGNVQSPGELVTPGGLSALNTTPLVYSNYGDFGLTADAPEAQRRIRLAAWITDPRNPLTARVLVNRVWQYHFGRGIVGTPNDFGYNGEAPTHPKLLDWLATALMGPGEWRIKRLHRVILLSSTYRQAATYEPRSARIDAEDRLLWRYSPRRLEAEAVRDAMLSVSGELNATIGGPSFRPFTVQNYGSDFYQLVDRTEPEYNRRTLYRMVVQSARSPLLETLDCPDPSTKTPRRTVTTTPTQALALMNDTFILRQSRALAMRVQKEVGNVPDAQITRAYALAFARPPTATERTQGISYLKQHALDSFCWALFNASEFLYVK